nr:ATP-binding protein [Vibrio coralliilyticus]
MRESPGLKGREIANRLGLDKKSVNSFLHHDDSGLFIRLDNEWYLSDKETVVEVAKTGWLRISDFENILIECEDLWSNSVDRIRFKFCDCSILLGAISRILCLVNQLAHEGKSLTLDFSECERSFTYLCRVGLFDELDGAIKVVPEVQDRSCFYGKNDKVMEFVSIPYQTEHTDLPTKLKQSFISLAGEEHANTAFGFIAEFINNIIEHSETSIPGVAALQVYEKGGHGKNVQTVFSDSGKGIVGTLRPVLESRYPDLFKMFPQDNAETNASLLKEVFEKGGISGAKDSNYRSRGLGMKISAKNAARFDATICIRQEYFEISLSYRDGKINEFYFQESLTKILGTHICFDFYLD